MRNSARFSSRCLAFLQALALCASVGADERALGPVFRRDLRIVTWRVASSRQIATIQPIVLEPLAAGGVVSLSFAHSGYSSSDPDGRNALLTLTLKIKKQPLSAAEQQAIAAAGIELEPRFAVMDPVRVRLDVQLDADASEAARIRKSLQLPRELLLSSSYPVQIRWSNVDGRVLYDLLTKADGLAFVIKWRADATLMAARQIAIDRGSLERWWAMYAGDANSLTWGDGAVAVVVSLFETGAIRDRNGPIDFESGIDVVSGLEQRIAALAPVSPSGSRTIAKADMLSLAGPVPTTPRSFSVALPIGVSCFPGRLLLDHPDLVTDLSGNSHGLDGLIGGQ